MGEVQGGEIEKEGRWVIYALRNSRGEIFYVGKSRWPERRLGQHRYRFGQKTTMAVLQDSFPADELPEQAERRWIYKLASQGCRLANKVGCRIRIAGTEMNIRLTEAEHIAAGRLADSVGLGVNKWAKGVILAEIERHRAAD